MSLKDDNPRTDEILRVCGWCKKIVVSEEVWEEIEKAAVALGLFERKEFPRLTHGICDGCYKKMSEELEKKRMEKKKGH